MPILSDVVPIILTGLGAYVGFEFGSSRREEIRRLFMPRSEEQEIMKCSIEKKAKTTESIKF